MSRAPEGDRCFPCHSPTLRPWITARRLRCRRYAVLRGGALEPDARTLGRNSQAKADASFSDSRQAGAENLSLSGGASIRTRSSSSWASPLDEPGRCRLQKRRRRPGWGRPRLARYAARILARTPPSEGNVADEPARRLGERPARQIRHGGCHRELGQMGEIRVQHDVPTDHRAWIGSAQVVLKRIRQGIRRSLPLFDRKYLDVVIQ